MPLSPRHTQQSRKNYALLCVLLGLMALFYVITIVKVAGLA